MRKTARDLKKREFEYFLKATICDVMRLFGYSKLPHVFETKLPGNEMMSFITIRNGKYSAIAYDYQKSPPYFHVTTRKMPSRALFLSPLTRCDIIISIDKSARNRREKA